MRQADELAWASQRLTAIERNATLHRTQTQANFERWRDTAPDGFVFAVNGPRGATQTADPAKARASIERFLGSGVIALGDRLGPIHWQFSERRRYDPGFLRAFLDHLPATFQRTRLRHAVELRHPSFAAPEPVRDPRSRGIGLVIADTDLYAAFHELTAA